jgi:hypothetical protein
MTTVTWTAGTAFTRLIEALERAGCRVTGSGRQRKAQCPAHDDRDPSLSITDGMERVLLNCRAGCATEDILAALGLGWPDLFGQSRSDDRPARHVVSEYGYTDERGHPLFTKVRYEPKGFSVKRPDGRGGWIPGLGEGTPRVLYRLPDVVAAVRDGRTVYLAEGEKDADRLAGLGYAATCNHDGAAKNGQRPKWRPEYGDLLRGADVVIVADRDEAGITHAQAAAADLKTKAKSVAIVQSAVTSEHADVSDHLDAGYGIGDLVPVAASDLPGGQDERSTGPHLPGVPEYPVSAPTGPLREIVDAGIAAGLPAPLMAGAALGVLATVSGMADLQIYPTWIVRPCLWIPLIAPAGGGKTPAITFARRKLRQLDAETHAGYSQELAMWLATPPKDRGEPPADLTRLINDITIEMVARWLAAGDGTGGVDADELAEWLRSLSKYRQQGGTDAARWLGLWSAQPWRYQRVDKHIDLLVPRPVPTVCGGIQPHLLHLLGPEGDGMRPRWLPHMSLTTDLAPRAGGATEKWDEAVEALYGARELRTWTMGEDVLRLWQGAQRRWKAAQKGAESPSATAALAKADEQAARLALVIAESLNPAAGGEIPVEAMTAAIAIIDYTLDCWRALPGHDVLSLSRRDWTLNQAVDQLAEWLERHGGSADRREIQRARVAGARTSDALSALLTTYEATYPGSVRAETPEERKGKRGPVATLIFAPRRDNTASQKPLNSAKNVSPRSVASDSSGYRYSETSADGTPGQEIAASAQETVASSDSLSSDSYLATVPATDSDTGGVPFWATAANGEEWSS